MTLPLPSAEAGELIYQDMVAHRAQPHELTREQARDVRGWLEADFYAFAQLVGGVVSPPLPAPLNYRLHHPVTQYFSRWGQPGWRRLMLQLPRGAYKTTLISRTGPLWLVCKDPNTTIAIFNEKVDRVRKWMLAIQSIVASNPLLHALWPEIIPPGVAKGDTKSRPRDWKWSADEMNFNRTASGIPEPTLSAMGVTGAAAGGHFEWIIWDDLLSDEAKSSPTVMQSVCDWMDTAIYLGKSPELVNIFCNCTRWLYGDAYEYAITKHNFTLYRRQALEGGQSSFPELWTTDHLLRMQAADAYNFNAQMQNDPMPARETAFDPAWVRYGQVTEDEWEEPTFLIDRKDWDPSKTKVDGEIAEQAARLCEMMKCVVVDPAATKPSEKRAEPRSRTAIVVRGIDWHGRKYLLDAWAGKETGEDQCRRILTMMRHWGVYRVACEVVTFSVLYEPLLRLMARQEFGGMHFQFIPLEPKGRDKDTRILGKAPDFQSGFEYVAHPCKALLMEELVAFPNSLNKDLLDALAYDRDPGVLPRPESPVEGDARTESDHQMVSQGGRYGLLDNSWHTGGQ